MSKAVQVFRDTQAIGTFVASKTETLKKVAPVGFNAEDMKLQLTIAASREPKLLKCNQQSLLDALVTAATYGLDVSGSTRQAWIVPFGETAQFVPGYQGLRMQLWRSGKAKVIKQKVVYSKDHFKYSDGVKLILQHDPILVGDRGSFIGAWALIEFKDGEIVHSWMRADEIAKREAMAKGTRDDRPWKKWPDKMREKTVLLDCMRKAPRHFDDFHRLFNLHEASWEDVTDETESDSSSVDELNNQIGKKAVARKSSTPRQSKKNTEPAQDVEDAKYTDAPEKKKSDPPKKNAVKTSKSRKKTEPEQPPLPDESTMPIESAASPVHTEDDRYEIVKDQTPDGLTVENKVDKQTGEIVESTTEIPDDQEEGQGDLPF